MVSSAAHSAQHPTCLGVSPLVGNPVDGVQQPLLVFVGVQLELGPGVVAELGDGHLRQTDITLSVKVASGHQSTQKHILIPTAVQT